MDNSPNKNTDTAKNFFKKMDALLGNLNDKADNLIKPMVDEGKQEKSESVPRVKVPEQDAEPIFEPVKKDASLLDDFLTIKEDVQASKPESEPAPKLEKPKVVVSDASAVMVDDDDDNETVLAEKDEQIQELTYTVAELEEQVNDLTEANNAMTNQLNKAIEERDIADKRLHMVSDDFEKYKARSKTMAKIEKGNSVKSIVKELLPALDALTHSIEHLKDKEEFAEVRDGNERIKSLFSQSFKKLGIYYYGSDDLLKKIPNPKAVEVVSLHVIDDANKDESFNAQLLSDGYKDGDVIKVLDEGYVFVAENNGEKEEPLVIRSSKCIVLEDQRSSDNSPASEEKEDKDDFGRTEPTAQE